MSMAIENKKLDGLGVVQRVAAGAFLSSSLCVSCSKPRLGGHTQVLSPSTLTIICKEGMFSKEAMRANWSSSCSPRLRPRLSSGHRQGPEVLRF